MPARSPSATGRPGVAGSRTGSTPVVQRRGEVLQPGAPRVPGADLGIRSCRNPPTAAVLGRPRVGGLPQQPLARRRQPRRPVRARPPLQPQPHAGARRPLGQLAVHAGDAPLRRGDQLLQGARDLVDQVVLQDLPLPLVEQPPAVGHLGVERGGQRGHRGRPPGKITATTTPSSRSCADTLVPAAGERVGERLRSSASWRCTRSRDARRRRPRRPAPARPGGRAERSGPAPTRRPVGPVEVGQRDG